MAVMQKIHESYMHNSFSCCPLLCYHNMNVTVNSCKYFNEIIDFNENTAVYMKFNCFKFTKH